MFTNQNVAENRKSKAMKMSAEVKEQQIQIDTCKDEAQRDLMRLNRLCEVLKQVFVVLRSAVTKKFEILRVRLTT
jgi:hypothetical protein